MAVTIDTQDVNNYPGNIKRVTLDLDSIIPTLAEGDEKYVLKATTTAYSDNIDNTAIQDLYVLESDVGWIKSSGLTGANGKFLLTVANCQLKVSMDSTISGTEIIGGNGYYEIIFEDLGVLRTGESIAEELETKIRKIAADPADGGTLATADGGYANAYRSCSVEFTGGKFRIISGTIGRYYTGQYRTSVSLQPGTLDCLSILGFNIPISSKTIAETAVTETLIGLDYVKDNSPLTIGAGTGVVAGDSVYITDGNHEDYFTVISGISAITVQVATHAVNGYTGISHDYTLVSGSMIQIVKKQDPDNAPNSYFDSVDALLRFSTKVVINQIDYS